MTPQATKAFFSVDIFQLLIYHIYYINFLSLILPPDMPGTVNVASINSKINKKNCNLELLQLYRISSNDSVKLLEMIILQKVKLLTIPEFHTN